MFLLVSPSILVFTLWSNFSLGTWLLAVTAFCVEVCKLTNKELDFLLCHDFYLARYRDWKCYNQVAVKVLVTVTVYALFMWDAHCQDGNAQTTKYL